MFIYKKKVNYRHEKNKIPLKMQQIIDIQYTCIYGKSFHYRYCDYSCLYYFSANNSVFTLLIRRN